MPALAWIFVALAVLMGLAYQRAPLWLWTGVVAVLLYLLQLDLGSVPAAGWLIFVPLALLLNLRPMRRALITKPILSWFRRVLPPLSSTELEALEAGSVWWDGELFTGAPDWQTLLDYPAPQLTEREQAFIDGPVQTLCEMLDEWQITAELNDLPREAWDFIGEHRFFGMIIPEAYGGLGFSAMAQSQVVMKIATRSTTAAVTVMVPNSLGPGELLLKYGTEPQKDRYLAKLARAEEIPCFALTGPYAGSDAGAIPDRGIVCKGQYEGREVVGFRVCWDKRYITLGPVATVLGLAFKAHDPDGILGERESLGVTCALVPTDTPGVEIGNRHYPLNSAFQNGPTRGKDVFIPMDWVIGGQDRIGDGWKMLMECLAAGRGISLPALSTGAGKHASRLTGAYARIRKQFRVPIGKFEGVQEALARIGGYAYRMDAARCMTATAIDLGAKPSVISAIIKYHLTEGMRQVVDDAMDVHGGRGILMGPMNYLARAYQATPVSITVEGANILTRSLIIFGQGSIRCHPYLLQEMAAASSENHEKALVDFDRALFAHIGFTVSNKVRAFTMAITGAHLVRVPAAGLSGRYMKQLTRLSSAFAFIADTTLLLLGGELKRREMLAARLGDVLSHLYLASTTIKHFEDQGRLTSDEPLAGWALDDSLYRIQEAIYGVLENYPVRWMGWALRLVVFPFGRSYAPPSDRLSHRVAKLLLAPGQVRDRLIDGSYHSDDPQDPVGLMECAMAATIASDPIEAKIHKAVGRLVQPYDYEVPVRDALAAGAISEQEAAQVRDAMALVDRAIAVDEFPGGRATAVTANRSGPSPVSRED
jgi:acyl-CoA dehydrogenase